MTLSREQIVDAAIRILDAEGEDGLSMRRLGAELDAGAASVYWHVAGKDELLDLVADRLIGEVLAGVSARDSWRDWMAAFARSLRRVLLAHRGAAPLVGRRVTTGPNALLALEAVTTLLIRDGFDAASSLLASTTLVAWTAMLVQGEVTEPRGAREAVQAAMDGTLEDGGGNPVVAGLLASGPVPTPDERFDYGLDVLLDGIETREARRRRGGTRGGTRGGSRNGGAAARA